MNVLEIMMLLLALWGVAHCQPTCSTCGGDNKLSLEAYLRGLDEFDQRLQTKNEVISLTAQVENLTEMIRELRAITANLTAEVQHNREYSQRSLNHKTCEEGNQNFRLMSGDGISYGHLEVRHSGEWGTVCDDEFDINDTRVACRTLGFRMCSNDVPRFHHKARYGQGTGRIWLDNLACGGGEASLLDCTHRGWGREDCGHQEDVSIDCRPV